MLTLKDNENEKVNNKCRNIQTLFFALFTALMNFSLKFMRWIKIIDTETNSEIVNKEMLTKFNVMQQEFIVYVSNKTSNKFYNYAINYMSDEEKIAANSLKQFFPMMQKLMGIKFNKFTPLEALKNVDSPLRGTDSPRGLDSERFVQGMTGTVVKPGEKQSIVGTKENKQPTVRIGLNTGFKT